MVDLEAVADAAITNPDLKVVHSFTLQLLKVDALANISNRCYIDVGLTDTGHVQIVFKSISNDNADYCYQISKVDY